LSDSDLVAAINGGDEAAFEALYYRHRDWVANLAYRWTGDRDMALDVVQEVFFVLAKKFPGFELTAKLRSFLYPVVRNLAVTALRKSGRHHPSATLLTETDNASPVDSPDESDGQLQTALTELGPEHRDVLLLRFVDELSLAEIADVLGIPVGTVKSRLHNGLVKLRANVQTKHFFE
jgi:RNA polymerase sigma-70 factor (ECF subfamily)